MRALSGSCSPWRSDFALEMEIEDLAVVERRQTWRIEDDFFFFFRRVFGDSKLRPMVELKLEGGRVRSVGEGFGFMGGFLH